MKKLILILALFALAFPCVAQRALTTAEKTSRTYSLTIAINTTTTEAVQSMTLLYGCSPVSILMPAAFTGTSLTVLGSQDGTTYASVTDEAGAAKTITVAASKLVALASGSTLAWRHFKLVSSASETAARTVKVHCR